MCKIRKIKNIIIFLLVAVFLTCNFVCATEQLENTETIEETIIKENILKEIFLKENDIKNDMLSAKSTTNFSSQKGFFYIQISGNGKTTKRKVEVTLSSINNISKEQTVTFKDVEVSGYSNNHNFKLVTTSAKTKPTDGYYTIFNLKFSYTKPAHYFANRDYSEKVDGYRFNFSKYDTDITTVNNTGHNLVNTTEVIEVQINARNCGIGTETDKTNVSNATGYINLYKGYYSGLTIDPNGGTHDGKSTKYNYGIKKCETTVTISNPIRSGYVFLGWTLQKGKNCSGAVFDNQTSKFEYCGASTSSTSASTDDTCVLTAQWLKNDSTLVLPEAGGIDLSFIFVIIGLIFLKKRTDV